MLLFLEKIIIFLCMNENFRVELKPKAVELTGKAFEALEKIQLSEFEKAGYKKPYKVLASEAIMAYSPPAAKPASPQDDAYEMAMRLLAANGGSKDKAAAAIYSGFPAEFKEQIKSRIMEGGRK